MIFNTTNAVIMGATIAAGIFLKHIIKNKKIGNFEIKRLLPIFILLIGEFLSVAYGIMTNENMIISISNGLTNSGIAAFGYDIFKSLYHNGAINDGSEEKK